MTTINELVAEHDQAQADLEAATVTLMAAQDRLKRVRAELARALDLGKGAPRSRPAPAPFDQGAVLDFLKKEDSPVLIRKVNTSLGIHATRADMEELISSGKVKVSGEPPALYYVAS